MAIDFSQVKEVKYNNQDVTKIERSGVTLWEKAVSVDNLINLINLFSAEYHSGTIKAKGNYNSILTGLSTFKVWWTLIADKSNVIDSNKQIIFPYKKARTGSTDSKFGIGSARANTSNEISSGTAVYGLTLTNGFDMTPYFKETYNSVDFYGGSFTITPGTSSSYPNKCLAGFLLENLYENGTQIPDSDLYISINQVYDNLDTYGITRAWCNNKLFKLDGEDKGILNYKLLHIKIQVRSSVYNYQQFKFALALESES